MSRGDAALCLAIGRGGVGLELAHALRFEGLTVTELSTALPGTGFPVDASGGVPRFRHRRGELRRVEVEIEARRLERWLAPKLRGVVGLQTPEVWIGARPDGATVCVAAVVEPDENPAPGGTPTLAFEVQVLADNEDVVLVVERARGIDLPQPATALALGCVEAALGRAASRTGALFRFDRPAAALARRLYPEAGARVPDTDRVRWISFAAHGKGWTFHAARDGVSAQPTEEALRAREIALVLRDGDDALSGGDWEGARSLYMDALEQAPKHVEVARRIVEIDARSGARAEAALSMLAETGATSVPQGSHEGQRASHRREDARLGTTPGELLAQIGDVDAALASLERAGASEPSPALAARAFEMAAGLARNADDAARWLDRAIAHAPRSRAALWMRALERIELGRLEDALADVEQLEALTRGGGAKHAVWLRAARAWVSAGLGAQAGALFERALRFVPDDPQALSGLGVALLASSMDGPARRRWGAARGVTLLSRALDVARSRGEATARIQIDLAQALAEHLDDLSTAIAHVAAVSPEAPEAPRACGLEGRWRARLGDLAGATLAYARLREHAASMAASTPALMHGAPPALARRTPEVDGELAAMAHMLFEAAEHAYTRMGDPRSAHRHLAEGLRLRPHDPELRRAYREMGRVVLDGDRDMDNVSAPVAMEAVGPAAPTVVSLAPVAPPLALAFASSDAICGPVGGVEDLTLGLQGDPTRDAIENELASLLAALSRGDELLGLVMARLEEATPERRTQLVPVMCDILGRMAADAQTAGRADEAAHYRNAAADLSR